MKRIQISAAIGTDIRTRLFFRRHIDAAVKPEDFAVLDFSGVEFVSRSVADEMVNILIDYPKTQIIGLSGDAGKMFDVVKSGRNKPRVYETADIKTVRLCSLEEVEDYFGNAAW